MIGEDRPLDAARRHLGERLNHSAAGSDRLETGILSALTGIADMTCRIGEHTDSPHYRADKAGPLLDEALRLQTRTLMAYAHVSGVDVDVKESTIHELQRLAEDITAALVAFMWAAARGDHIYERHARALTRTAQHLTEWAERVARSAIPDPMD